MHDLILDLKYGIRQLSRQRGSSIVAVLTLSLGIGVSTAIFSVIDVTMLRPVPYPDPEQLVRVGIEEVLPTGESWQPSPAMSDMRLLQEADDAVTSVAGWSGGFRGRIAEGDAPERIQVWEFTEDFLSMHGVAPLVGRGFTRADTDQGAPLVAMLGYGYWQSRFGGRTDVIGETVRLDADVATVVGVLPAWFEHARQVAVPLRVPPAMFMRRGSGRVDIYARLRPGVTIEQAREQLSARLAGTKGSQPGVTIIRATVTSRIDDLTSRYRTTVNVLAGAVGLILLIAAVNVGGLLLARGAARQSELAVRASLGAGRARLIRQLLAESLVLVVPATALGMALAWLSLDALVANLPFAMPDNSPIAVNPTVVGLTIAVLVPASVIFALVPAVRLSRVRINSVLARGGRQVGSSLSRRGGQAMIAAEVALAVVLVAGAGLMIRSFMRMSAVDLGFEPGGLLTMEVMPLERTPAANRDYFGALLQRLRAVPGIASVGVVDNFALSGSTSFSSVAVEGEFTPTTMFEVTPGYLETIGARLREGRFPADADRNPAVINESAARRMFPNRSPIGRELTPRGQDERVLTVVGVIADLRHNGPLDARSIGMPQVFLPLASSRFQRNAAMLVVARPSGRMRGLGDELRNAAQSIGPRVLVERIRSSEEWFGDRVLTPRRRMVLLSLLGGFGLILALVGVFGVTAYAVTRRTPEIGVRIAFGARRNQVVRTMVRDAATPIVLGTVIGVAGASAGSRVIESFLFQTDPADLATLAVVAIILIASGCLAALVPSLRAAKVDPAVSLRSE